MNIKEIVKAAELEKERAEVKKAIAALNNLHECAFQANAGSWDVVIDIPLCSAEIIGVLRDKGNRIDSLLKEMGVEL